MSHSNLPSEMLQDINHEIKVTSIYSRLKSHSLFLLLDRVAEIVSPSLTLLLEASKRLNWSLT